MTAFVDASALIAIITGEPEAGGLMTRLNQDDDIRTSGVAYWEAVVGLSRILAMELRAASNLLARFLIETHIRIEAIDESVARLAVDAFEIFGKGRHPASLNMGDCFAYACAKAIGGDLIYKGQDFSKTDLA